MRAARRCASAAGLALAFASASASQAPIGPGGSPDPAHPDLYAWYAAWSGVNAAATAIDGAPVARWDDLSVHGRHLTRVDAADARRPTFRLHAADGAPAIEFDGDDYLWADAGAEFGAMAGDKTVFFVARVRSADGGYLFDGTSAQARNAVFTGQASAPHRWHGYSGGAASAGADVDHDALQVHSVEFVGGSVTHRVGGAVISSGPGAGQPLGGLTLGARYTLDHRLIGDVAELLFYGRQLSASERQAVEGYLTSRYPPQAPPEEPAATDVFVGGVGYPAFRIPSLLRTEAGVLLAFAEGRQTLNDHSQNDIVLRRSVDGGQSWGSLQVLHDDGANSLNNPCAVQVKLGANAGRVLLMYQRYPAGCHVNCVVPGHTGPNVCRSFLVFSDDDGLTWSPPQELTAQVKPATLARAVNSGPGLGIQKRRAPHLGRILFPFNRLDVSGHWWNYAVYSDDGGATWSYGALVDDSQTPGQGNEVQFFERVDGAVALNARSVGGTRHRKTAVSFDGGATWSPMSEDGKLNEPQVMASVLRWTDPLDGNRSRVLYAGPNSRVSRANGTVQVSYDEGASWRESKVVRGGFFAYSCLAAADDRRIGVLYEAAGYARIAFAAMTVEWLSDCRDCLGDGAHGAAYGAGCPGAGGWTPRLLAYGCPTPGGAVTLQVDQAPGATLGVVALGSGAGSAPLGACTADVLPSIGALSPFVFSGAGPGAGVAMTNLPLPAALQPTTVTAQAFVLDPTVPQGLNASTAWELVIF